MKRIFTLFCSLFALFSNLLFSQIPLPYNQDFETITFPPTACQFFGGTNPTWMRASSVGGFGNSSGSMYYDNFTINNSGNYSGIRMPGTVFSGVTAPAISFDVAYARFDATRSDALGIWYSLNGTSGWINLITYQNGTLTTAPDQTTFFIPDSTQWVTKTLSLPALQNLPYVRLAFENNSDHGNVLYVDNVRIFDENAISIFDPDGLSQEYMGFPNPVSDYYYLVHSNPIEKFSFQVFDSKGMEIQMNSSPRKMTTNKVELNFSDLQSGIYFLQIETEKGFFCKKVSVE